MAALLSSEGRLWGGVLRLLVSLRAGRLAAGLTWGLRPRRPSHMRDHSGDLSERLRGNGGAALVAGATAATADHSLCQRPKQLGAAGFP